MIRLISQLLIAIVLGVTIYRVAEPYIFRYYLKLDVEEIATYATRHDEEETRRFIEKKIKEEGLPFETDNFWLDYDEGGKVVTVTIDYSDEIDIFGEFFGVDLTFFRIPLDFKISYSQVRKKKYF